MTGWVWITAARGVDFHGMDQPDDRVALHQAVRIENDHVFVGATEPPDPLCDIAGFPGGVVGSMPIVQPVLRHSGDAMP